MTRSAPRLPEFPWDTLADQSALARRHPGGLVDLSVGTPVDPVPAVVREALASVADQPGYPATHGTPALREATIAALARRFGVTGVPEEAVLPTIGSKELVAWLPTLLGVRPGQVVAIPELAYPTYEVGARLAGAEVVRLAVGEAPPEGTALVWLNSPSNPTGRVLSAEDLVAAVEAARRVGAVVASDECYLSLGWEAEPVSVLHPSVSGGRLDGLLAVHSLSKSSNLAGYRAGFVTGDPALVASLLHVRKHAGMIVPRPVQAAMTAALADDEHVAAQKAVYAARRDRLRPALEAAGFKVDHSEAGLYLWTTRGEDAWETVGWFAERGILVAPGTFYGPNGGQHVRIALTASDERVAAAVERLA
ncbi:succinyldiaminopimelate aminotransferase apoenzyme [Streptoalloteichus tenebrarius]|uniref:Aminotransferase n=1 Tax=Streptoalloteichus tenebrarius (strain ATCC 17920 / DSM 40477 / JCM 4838 / CBS 697.72 / NBRC 16177 / NCIMB 11028 / NRRL B-12390 / A12253. 1 / ISP 5477) TaxID=1933 RepID=A0ABT1I350_STRSD|nr:succinyldiaminopimelate transaminase [Streptoalloteichus tenebrarius]MCP2262218.1 succinyldiaminopimelate aminotransferase apoenzyme [Streptoalloteichus tenebrarius]BFF01082.1 succinyldiaminopimelate transaminase [Streptoalloteichus tenebrarius]